MSRTPLTLLQGFVLAAKAGKLAHAAEQLNVTVSALSHQIRQLEIRVGRQLFERGPRGVKLTPEGQRLLDEVGHHVDGIERALQRYRGRREDALTLSLIPSVASSWMVPRLPRLVARHPEIEISLQSTTALVDFDREPVDAAMRYGTGNWPSLRVERLFGEYIVPVASPALIERMGGVTAGGFANWPILGDPGGRWKDWFEHAGGETPRRYAATFDNTETLHRAALEGIGVALGRLVMARPLIAAGLLTVLSPRRLRVAEAYYLVYPPRAENHAGVIAFREWLLEEAACYEAALDTEGS
jgi:LysR family transcriptional regulator, glycine cleavage system transcriptional activator